MIKPHSLLPVGLLAAFHRLSLAFGLVAGTVAGTLGLHVGNSGVVEYLNGTTVERSLQFVFTESAARLVEVRDIELVIDSEFMSYLLLLGAVTCVLQSEQFGYLNDFSL